MARLIPNVHSLRHVEAALDHDLDGDDISDAARAIYDGEPWDCLAGGAEPPADHLGVAIDREGGAS